VHVCLQDGVSRLTLSPLVSGRFPKAMGAPLPINRVLRLSMAWRLAVRRTGRRSV